MGAGICADQNLSKLQQNTTIFMDSIKYYDSECQPISKQVVDVYSYKTIFIQKKSYKLDTKNDLIKIAAFLAICARCPAGVQPIFRVHSQRDIKLTYNYSISLYAQHLNFSFKSYLDSFRAKGVTLSTRQIFYILRQMVKAGSYLQKKKLSIKSFDPDELYVSSTYEIKIPIQNIIGNQQENEYPEGIDLNRKNQLSKEVLYLSPEQLIQPKNKRIHPIYRVFSLGILIMQCCTMLDGAVSYYNYNSQSIDIKKLNNDVKSVKDVILGGVLSRMLQIDYNKRITFRQLQVIISKLDPSMFVNYLLIE